MLQESNQKNKKTCRTKLELKEKKRKKNLPEEGKKVAKQDFAVWRNEIK